MLKTQTRLSKEDHQLIERAKETADRLHLEGIHEVAAALRTKGGTVYTGIHTNASVGYADICGEIAAICVAVANGHRDVETIVAVWGDGKGEHKLLSPCGRCREVISDFNMDAWVIVGTLQQPYKVRVSELLPLKYNNSKK